jgi:hypothetical protein
MQDQSEQIARPAERMRAYRPRKFEMRNITIELLESEIDALIQKRLSKS